MSLIESVIYKHLTPEKEFYVPRSGSPLLYLYAATPPLWAIA